MLLKPALRIWNSFCDAVHASNEIAGLLQKLKLILARLEQRFFERRL